MIKMKRVYAILLFITILFSISVEVKAYNSDDILKEYVEEENKEDKQEEEKKEENYTKASINLNNATYIRFAYSGNLYQWYASFLDADYKYYIEFNYNNNIYELRPTINGYFIRGNEGDSISRQVFVISNGEVLANVDILGYTNNQNGKSVSVIEYIEPTPTPTPTPTPNPEETVSGNYAPALNIIIENQERIISQNEVLLQSTIRIGDAIVDISNNQIVSVNGIMEKNINDYTTQEGLLLIIVVLAVSVVIVSAIKRGILKWK